MQRLLLFLLVGLAAQLVDGSLGMAYGVTASTLLVAGGVLPAAASASVHLAEVWTTLVSGLSHWRLGNVDWRVVRWIGLPGAAGAFLGAHVLSRFDGASMRPWVSGLLCLLGAGLVARFAFGAGARPPRPRIDRPGRLLPLGLLGGFVDAVGGGGWGPVVTPSLIALGRMEPRRAVGTVSASEFAVALAASVGFLIHLGREAIEIPIVAGLAAGGVLAAPAAAWLVRRLPTPILGSAVGALVVLSNSRNILRSVDANSELSRALLLALATLGAVCVGLAARHAGPPSAAVPPPAPAGPA
jgi:uncharacterized membrane protein YfcA